MIVLGIDPGTTMGWALLAGDGKRISSGAWDFARTHDGQRYLQAYRKLRSMIEAHEVDLICFEEVQRHTSTRAAHVYGGMAAIIMMLAEMELVPYTSVHWATVKKRATGSGRAKKRQMVDAALAQWGNLPSGASEDEADALWIALTGMELAYPTKMDPDTRDRLLA